MPEGYDSAGRFFKEKKLIKIFKSNNIIWVGNNCFRITIVAMHSLHFMQVLYILFYLYQFSSQQISINQHGFVTKY